MKPRTSGLSPEESDREALDLRLSGTPYTEIADQLGYAGTSGAYDAVQRAMEAPSESIDEARRLELERLDAILTVQWPKVLAGNGRAADRVLSVMARRARLLGLNSTQPVHGPSGEVDPVDELTARRSARQADSAAQ